jgi:hypothetical protein
MPYVVLRFRPPPKKGSSSDRTAMMNQSNPLTTKAEACSPDPDRAGTAVPANIAALLYVVTTLLEYARHLVATIERRATMPGFSLFVALFGTAKLSIILAHLHRGILRATALETMLLQRAATGRDVKVPPPRVRTPSGADAKDHAADQPIDPQIAGLAAERAKYDAPIDPAHLPTPEQIAAEVRNRPFGRTIAEICRDLGIVPGLCTRAFWDAIMEAIVCYDGSAMTVFQQIQRRSEHFEQMLETDPDLQQMDQAATLFPDKTLGFKLGEPPLDPFRDDPMPSVQRQDVPLPKDIAPPEATGPPLPEAMKLAA